MPDSSDRPTPATPPPEPGGKPVSPMPGAEPLSLVPRTRSGASKEAAPAETAAPPASLSDFMHWMKTLAASADAAPLDTPKPVAAGQRATLPKAQRKFQRFDREGAAPDQPAGTPPLDGVDGEEPPPENAAQTDDPAAVPSERSTPSYAGRPVPIALTGGTVGRRSRPASARGPYFWLATQLGAFLLLVLTFFLGRLSVSKVIPPVKNAAPAAPSMVAAEGDTINTLSPEDAKLIDEAMAAEQDRNFSKATDLLKQVQKDLPGLRDLDYRLALLALEDNDPARALPMFNQCIAEGEQPGSSYKLRGTILNRQGGGTRGMNDFENAALADPFGAENFFFWGEALRRLGKPQAALTKLQQAIDRLREPALESQYRLKIRLTQIQLGQEEEFAAAMAKQLAQNPPSPHWLLTAAAVELHRNNFPAAAEYLDKASIYMEKDLFELSMRDFFFYGYRFSKPLERFFAFAKAEPPPAPPAANSPTPNLPDTSPLLQDSPGSAPGALPTVAP